MNGPFAAIAGPRVRVMLRPFPTFVAALTAAVLVAVVTAQGHWLAHNFVVVGVALLAVGVCAFNWWELWSDR
jgi:hypothetical protein